MTSPGFFIFLFLHLSLLLSLPFSFDSFLYSLFPIFHPFLFLPSAYQIYTHSISNEVRVRAAILMDCREKSPLKEKYWLYICQCESIRREGSLLNLISSIPIISSLFLVSFNFIFILFFFSCIFLFFVFFLLQEHISIISYVSYFLFKRYRSLLLLLCPFPFVSYSYCSSFSSHSLALPWLALPSSTLPPSLFLFSLHSFTPLFSHPLLSSTSLSSIGTSTATMGEISLVPLLPKASLRWTY